MRNEIKSSKHLLVASLLFIAASAASWQTIDNKKKNDQATNNQSAIRDTSVPKERHHDKDEFGMTDLDNAIKELDIQLKDLDIKMKDLDIKISGEIKDALAGVDFEKISRDVTKELKKIDFDKIKVELDQSLKEAQEQIKKVDMEKIKQQVEETKKSFNSQNFKQHIEGAVKNAREGIEKAKKELKELKEFRDALEKDGLIDKTKGYTIEWKNGGELYINGNKQSKEVSDRYRKYYKKDGFKMKINEDYKNDDGRVI